MTMKPKAAPMPKSAAAPPPSMDISVMTEAGPNSVRALCRTTLQQIFVLVLAGFSG